jgi:hypothetical protein
VPLTPERHEFLIYYELQMASKEEVELFLSQLKTKISHFGIAFKPRDKNTQGLADLDILPYHREEFINKLTYKDFCSGPNCDTHNPGRPDYYVFGIKMPNGEWAYVKLSPGSLNKRVDCMSFHKAEQKLEFPLKN